MNQTHYLINQLVFVFLNRIIDTCHNHVFGSIFSYEKSLLKKERGRNWRKTIPNITYVEKYF